LKKAATVVAALTLLAQQALAQTAAYPDRSMGSPDPKRNLVIDEQPAGIRVLSPVPLYAKGGGGFANWPGKLPGAQEVTKDGNVFNVSEPTFQAFLPPATRNSRTAVIVAPGGGFRMLSINSEGTDVAHWLAARGIAAFVLKYRIVQQPGPDYSMAARLNEFDFDVAGGPGVADGTQAIRMIRDRADEYGIDPNRMVFIGFSAGAHVASWQALNPTAADRPNYVAPIYGGPLGKLPALPPVFVPGTIKQMPAMGGITLPASGTPNPEALPPAFIAGSQDDFLVGKLTRRFYDALVEAGYNPEGHFYANGLHGYGLNESNSTSRHFIEQFYWWMESLGLTRKPGDPDLKQAPFDPRALGGNPP
jgi:acetyl esterase/lipase